MDTFGVKRASDETFCPSTIQMSQTMQHTLGEIRSSSLNKPQQCLCKYFSN